MDRKDDEALWDLLAKSVEPEPSPFFARNVLRRVRQSNTWLERVRSQFTIRRMVPAAGLAGAIAAALLLVPTISPPPRGIDDADILAKIDPQDYEIVADLDDLLAGDENSLWTDSSSL